MLKGSCDKKIHYFVKIIDKENHNALMKSSCKEIQEYEKSKIDNEIFLIKVNRSMPFKSFLNEADKKALQTIISLL